MVGGNASSEREKNLCGSRKRSIRNFGGIDPKSLRYNEIDQNFELKAKGKTISGPIVVNCNGTGHRNDRPFTPPLLKNLIRRDPALGHPLGGGLRVKYETSQVIGSHGPIKGLYAIGDLSYFALFATADCKQIVDQVSKSNTLEGKSLYF